MKVLAEVYKGIEFVRISNLPEDQKENIKSISKDHIIKILKDKVVMKDCIQYHNYLTWYADYKSQPIVVAEQRPILKQRTSSYKLAFR